jgi:hypothetical protein
VNHQWIVALGLSSKVFLAVRERTERYVPSRLLHELLGYLTACDCEVIPVDFRCPLAWRQAGSLESIRGMWVRQFLDQSDRYLFARPEVSHAQPFLALPVATVAEDAIIFWRAAGLVAGALSGTPNEQKIRPLLGKISASWERRWNHNLLETKISATDEIWIHQCDYAWAAVVHAHLAPFGYEMQTGSLARLL